MWKEEELQGKTDGAKDRPCAIVVATKPDAKESVRVMVVAITHTPPPPFSEDGGIEVPTKVARHLGFDEEQSWIKTHQVNTFTWPKDRLPFGVIPVRDGEYIYGSLPDALNKQIHAEVKKHLDSASIVDRDTDDFQ